MRLTTIALLVSLVAVACSTSVDPATPEPTAPADPPTTLQFQEPNIPPDVDTSSHSVPLEEVYFDTFDGGSVPLSDSTLDLRAALLDVIPPIDQPVYGDTSTGDWLDPDDLLLGYVAGDQAYAYPFKILNFHEIVNDVLDGTPVLISYCPLCRSGIVYDRRLGGEVLSFGNTSALYESDLVMVDRGTGSYWWQVAGTAIVGPLTGADLQPLPSIVSTWEDWVTLYPNTLLLSRDTGHERPYERDVFASYADSVDAGRFPFPVGEAALDDRLAASALVVGVSLGGDTRAYPVDGLSEPINDEVGGTPVVLLPTDGGAAVFDATIDGDVLQFEQTAGQLLDTATGSVWTATGIAVSGPLAGAALEPVPSRTTFWFAFVGAFPDTELFSS